MAEDFKTQVEKLRPYLLRYAQLQLRSAEAAEDAVQEALVAALAGASGFAGRSNLRTWLTGILKHKIVDAIRKSSRELQPLPGEDDAAEFDTLFDERGHWSQAPDAWELPEKTAQAFMMREHLGLETAEICKELAITSTHCWVMLYRARMALRLCLQESWFK